MKSLDVSTWTGFPKSLESMVVMSFVPVILIGVEIC